MLLELVLEVSTLSSVRGGGETDLRFASIGVEGKTLGLGDLDMEVK
jgi:hypothetical protein